MRLKIGVALLVVLLLLPGISHAGGEPEEVMGLVAKLDILTGIMAW